MQYNESYEEETASASPFHSPCRSESLESFTAESRTGGLGDSRNIGESFVLDVCEGTSKGSARGARYIQPGDFLVTPDGPQPPSFIVYGLAKADNRVKYVGRSVKAKARLAYYISKFGPGIQMVVLEVCRNIHHLVKQERYWIKSLEHTGLWNQKDVDPKYRTGNSIQPKRLMVNVEITEPEHLLLLEAAARSHYRGVSTWVRTAALEEAKRVVREATQGNQNLERTSNVSKPRTK